MGAMGAVEAGLGILASSLALVAEIGRLLRERRERKTTGGAQKVNTQIEAPPTSEP